MLLHMVCGMIAAVRLSKNGNLEAMAGGGLKVFKGSGIEINS